MWFIEGGLEWLRKFGHLNKSHDHVVHLIWILSFLRNLPLPPTVSHTTPQQRINMRPQLTGSTNNKWDLETCLRLERWVSFIYICFFSSLIMITYSTTMSMNKDDNDNWPLAPPHIIIIMLASIWTRSKRQRGRGWRGSGTGARDASRLEPQVRFFFSPNFYWLLSLLDMLWITTATI